MTTLQWGDLTLSVDASKIYTFDGFDWSMGFKTKEKEVKKKKPSVSAKAPNLEQINITIKLNASLGVSAQEEIDKWRTACNAGTANELFIGGDRFGDASSTWRIKTFKVGEVKWDPRVRIETATLSVAFEENAKKAKAKKKKKKSSSGGGKKKPSSSTVPSSSSSSSSNSTPPTERYRAGRAKPPPAGSANK